MKPFFLPLLAVLATAVIASCASTPTSVVIAASGVDAETKPLPLFSEKKFNAVSVQAFDAKGVETWRGALVDYVELGRNFTDDLVRRFYETGRFRVVLGETVDSVSVGDLVERRVGDINVKRNELGTTTVYKASPFRKVDVQISGRILRYQAEPVTGRSFVEIYLRATDTYDGTVYWITRIKGNWDAVQKTIVDTVGSGVWTPAGGVPGEVTAGTNAAPAK